jgi:Fungal rhodopsin domain
MGFVTAMTIATMFSVVFQCLPIESNWVLADFGTRKCINRVDQQYATSALAFTTDIAILVLPMKYLLRMF